MQTLAALERRIKSADDLLGVVKTMKALAAVNIRQYETAVHALQASADTVETALRAVLRRSRSRAPRTAHDGGRTAAIIFGSDQGMCGSLNERIVRHALAGLDELGVANDDRRRLAVGVQVASRLETANQPADEVFLVPGSVPGIAGLVYDILDVLDDWQRHSGITRVMLYHAHLLGSASWEPTTLQLLPFDRAWFQKLAERGWATNQLPQYRESPRELFSALLHHYLFIALFRATGESLASENASRLGAMQVAETHIGERLDELQLAFQQERQTAVTAELLDIISGFQTLRED